MHHLHPLPLTRPDAVCRAGRHRPADDRLLLHTSSWSVSPRVSREYLHHYLASLLSCPAQVLGRRPLLPLDHQRQGSAS